MLWMLWFLLLLGWAFALLGWGAAVQLLRWLVAAEDDLDDYEGRYRYARRTPRELGRHG